MRTAAESFNIMWMHRPVPALRRLTFATVAGLLVVTPLATRASAATSAQCTRLAAPAPAAVGGVRMRTATMTGCTPVSATGGSGTSVTNLDTLVGTITWANGRGTTTVSVSYKAGAKPNRCPAGMHLTISGGKVVGGTGAALGVIKVGSTLSARWCVDTKFAATLEPGSVHKFSGAADGNAPPPAVALPAGLADCPAGTRGAVVALINRDRRVTANRAPLTENANLDWAARKHSIAMAKKSASFHDGWDTEIGDSHYVAGPPGWTGQNVGWMITPIAPNLPALIESGYFNEVPPHDGHRLNILNAGYHKVGIGCIVKKSTGAIFSTQDFGS